MGINWNAEKLEKVKQGDGKLLTLFLNYEGSYTPEMMTAYAQVMESKKEYLVTWEDIEEGYFDQEMLYAPSDKDLMGYLKRSYQAMPTSIVEVTYREVEITDEIS